MTAKNIAKGAAGLPAGGVFELFTIQWLLDFAAIIKKDSTVIAAGNVVTFGSLPAGSLLLGMTAYNETADTGTADAIKVGTGADDDGYFTALDPNTTAGTLAAAGGALAPVAGGIAFSADTPLTFTLATNMPTDGVIVITAVCARCKRA